ncbi:MAG: hypothetical protein ACYCZI_04130 [Metallibacterium scheffleri]
MDPITWVILIVALVAAIYVYASMPSAPSKKPPSLADLQTPTVEDGREILMVFGEQVIDDNNELWHGDLQTTPIKTKSGK